MRRLLAALALSLTLAASGAELNARGFKLYQQKKYAEALELFRKATEVSPRLALAHYNFAATLSLLRKLEGPCEHDAYRGQIMSELERAVRLDPKRKARALEDTDFESVHDTFGWQTLILGRTIEHDAGAILQAVTWYGWSPGAYGPMAGLAFGPDGKLDEWHLDVSGETVQRLSTTGTWSVEGAKVTVTYDKKTLHGTLEKSGVLRFGEERSDQFTDEPDDCSA